MEVVPVSIYHRLRPATITLCLGWAVATEAMAEDLPVSTTNPRDDSMLLLLVPAGEATFGSSGGGGSTDESPQFRASLPAYYMGETEVTNAQYRRFMSATGRRIPDEWEGGGILAGMDDSPVVKVSWEDAQAYCAWAGLRLPTELEWEKAARGRDGFRYPWGDRWDDHLCCCSADDDMAGPVSVGGYPSDRSPYGLLDMAGNAAEWCADWYDASVYTRYAGGSISPPSSGRYRVFRGGAYRYAAEHYIHSANRLFIGPTIRLDFVGFRCARDAGALASVPTTTSASRARPALPR